MAATAVDPSFHFFCPPLKYTSPVNFPKRLEGVTLHPQALELLRELYDQRENLLLLIQRDPSTSHEEPEIVREATHKYVSLFGGLLDGPGALKESIKYVWTNSVGAVEKEARCDAVFEFGTVIALEGIWLLRYAAKFVETNKTPSEDDQKVIYAALLQASARFEYVETLSTAMQTPLAVDMESRVLSGFRMLALAQAQEITVKRAVEKGVSPRLIAKLSVDLMAKYKAGSDLLESLGGTKMKAGRVTKLRLYLEFKSSLYSAYAYFYTGVVMKGGERIGPAIRCADECVRMFETAANKSTIYAREAPKTNKALLPQELSFQEKVRSERETWVKENDFITFDKVPEIVPDLPEPQTLLDVPTYERVETSGLWSQDVYASFDTSKIQVDNSSEDVDAPEGEGDNRSCIIL